MWLLTMHFVRQIVHYNGTVLSYYKSYYLARAGLELSLTQISNRGVGFEYDVNNEDTLVQENFACTPECGFASNIQWQTQYLNKSFWSETGCTAENAFVLASGQVLMLPLFKDNYLLQNQADVFDEHEYQSIFLQSNFVLKYKSVDQKNLELTDEINLWLVTSGYITVSKKYTENDFNEDVIDYFLFDEPFTTKVRDEMHFRKRLPGYLLISNPTIENKYLSFCVEIQKHAGSIKNYTLPTETAYIKSVGSYGFKSIGLEAIYSHDVLPSFFAHGHLEL